RKAPDARARDRRPTAMLSALSPDRRPRSDDGVTSNGPPSFRPLRCVPSLASVASCWKVRPIADPLKLEETGPRGGAVQPVAPERRERGREDGSRIAGVLQLVALFVLALLPRLASTGRFIITDSVIW